MPYIRSYIPVPMAHNRVVSCPVIIGWPVSQEILSLENCVAATQFPRKYGRVA